MSVSPVEYLCLCLCLCLSPLVTVDVERIYVCVYVYVNFSRLDMEPEVLKKMDPGGTDQQDDEELPCQTGTIAISLNSPTGGEGVILSQQTDAPVLAPAPAVLTELEVYMCIGVHVCMRACTDEIRN
jgi:hypothetical protein